MSTQRKQVNWGETIVPAITLLFIAAYFYQTRDASAEVLRWPLAIAILTGILWLGVLFFFLFAPPAEESSRPFAPVKALLILLAPIVYILATTYLGFALASFLFLLIMFRCLGGISWWRNILVALIITGGLYFIMIGLMEMSLPRLDLGFILL